MKEIIERQTMDVGGRVGQRGDSGYNKARIKTYTHPPNRREEENTLVEYDGIDVHNLAHVILLLTDVGDIDSKEHYAETLWSMNGQLLNLVKYAYEIKIGVSEILNVLQGKAPPLEVHNEMLNNFSYWWRNAKRNASGPGRIYTVGSRTSGRRDKIRTASNTGEHAGTISYPCHLYPPDLKPAKVARQRSSIRKG